MKILYLLTVTLGFGPFEFQVQELPSDLTPPPAFVFVQEELPEPERKADSRPEFELLTAKWCGACQGVKQALERADKKSLPFIVSYHDVDSKGWLGAREIPAWAYRGRIFQYGYSTPENLVDNYQKIVVNTSVKSTSLKGYPSYQGYKPRWTWPGDLRQHLRQVHGVTESLTQDQAEALHDALHEGYTLQQIRNKFKGN